MSDWEIGAIFIAIVGAICIYIGYTDPQIGVVGYILGILGISVPVIVVMVDLLYDNKAEEKNPPLINLEVLSQIPGLRITGAGIDIDTTKLNDGVTKANEMFDRYSDVDVQAEDAHDP